MINDMSRQRSMKKPARMVVNLVQKDFPLVPKRLWPVPEKSPPAVFGCWIKTTAMSKMAVKTKRTVTTMFMELLKV